MININTKMSKKEENVEKGAAVDSAAKIAFQALIDKYAKQNPAKFAIKKDEFARKLAVL